MANKQLGIYANGNTIVEIREDGTKIRYVPDDTPARPEFPESIDMKICNRCEIGCPQCHECSSPDGKLGDLSNKLIDSLRPYTELAIGGGDPLSHPDLPRMLQKLKERKVIVNITVHWKSFMNNLDLLHEWEREKFIYGIGISVNETVDPTVINEICKFKNPVVHTILGIADVPVYSQLYKHNLNILLLGYKTFGRGMQYRINNGNSINHKIEWVKNHVNEFTKQFRAICFDNLAVEQLDLKHQLRPEEYEQFYMGGDGSFTMYVDLVENKFAVSSTSRRHDIFSNNIVDLFKEVRKESKN